MASGLPAVAFSVGGLVERIEHGESGLLVPQGNVEELATALESILQDGDRLHKMSIKARFTAEQQFDLSIVTAKYIKIYAGI
ncbi:MAG: glycosyltransferase family 4 protein, partial [Oceanicoccus sp.]|uniref:glycosyltransferase n=1 Tax=Oceanicoccus sp. TaxID=2691044 RepID=UPI00262E2D9E